MNKINISDYICDMPVQMFYFPQICKDHIDLYSGKGNIYKVGDTLQLESLCYKYNKSCLILDFKNIKKDKLFGVIIHNELIIGYKEIQQSDFKDIQSIYLQTGEELNLDCYEDIFKYIEKLKILEEDLKKNELQHINLMIEMQERSEKDDNYFILNKSKLDKILYESVKINKDFQKRWFIVKEEEEQIIEFGAYLSCLVEETIESMNTLEMLISNNESEISISKCISAGEKKLGFIKDNFSTFLYNNKGLNLKYLEWLDLKNSIIEKTQIDVIKDIIENIYYYLES